MIVGKRYKLPHGTGVYLGYEDFYADGMKSRVIEKAPPGEQRCVFKLDPDHTWCFDGNHYCAWGKQIEELEDEPERPISDVRKACSPS